MQSKCKVYWNEKFPKILVLCTSIKEFEQCDNSLNDSDLQKKMVNIFFSKGEGEVDVFVIYDIHVYLYIQCTYTDTSTHSLTK